MVKQVVDILRELKDICRIFVGILDQMSRNASSRTAKKSEPQCSLLSRRSLATDKRCSQMATLSLVQTSSLTEGEVRRISSKAARG